MKKQRRNGSDRSVDSQEYSGPILFDLVIEILSRLPAKSIARCRCVSKLWYTTLRLPYFTELFLTRSSSRRQLLFSYEENGNLHFLSSCQPQYILKGSLSLVSANYQNKFPIDGDVKIIGSVHGLVCTTHFRRIKQKRKIVPVICNPSTGQSLTLPKVKSVAYKCFFGYDPIEKQYKVLSMALPGSEARMISWGHQILTLGTQNPSWRKVKCSIIHDPVCDTRICMNGVLYYVATETNSPEEYMIIWFDVRSEKFRRINKDEGMRLAGYPALANYKGKLCALLLSSDCYRITKTTRSFEMWVLEDAEKHEWSKHIYKLPASFLKNIIREAMLYFVGVINDTNEIVLAPCYLAKSDHFIVVYYNIKRKTIRRDEIRGIDVTWRVDTFLDHIEDVKLM